MVKLKEWVVLNDKQRAALVKKLDAALKDHLEKRSSYQQRGWGGDWYWHHDTTSVFENAYAQAGWFVGTVYQPIGDGNKDKLVRLHLDAPLDDYLRQMIAFAYKNRKRLTEERKASGLTGTALLAEWLVVQVGTLNIAVPRGKKYRSIDA